MYKESYEFPYTERVGNENRTFQDESEFLTFLREEEDASTLWMTHVCMQAVSTMLNIKINILTTGITTPIINRCPRCKPPQNFHNDEDLRIHTEKVHHRAETEEEREGRRQKARWSELQPDYRIAHKSVAGNAEEMILLHEDNIHYNIIVHKSHNGVRRENGINEHEPKHREDSESIFGERLYEPPKISKSWAQAAKASLLPQAQSVSVNSKDNTNLQDISKKVVEQSENAWETVIKKGNTITNKKYSEHTSPDKKNVSFVLPINNRFANLAEHVKDNTSDSTADCNKYACKGCSYIFQSKMTLEDHKRNAHGPKLTNSEMEVDKEEIIKDLKQQLIKEKKASTQASKNYNLLKRNIELVSLLLQ